MTRLLLILIILFFSAHDVLAAKGIARVRVEIVPDGIQATYRLSQATAKFDFATADVARDDTFSVVTPDMVYTAGSITSTKPFRRFVLRVKSSTVQYDGKYASLRAFGDGRVLYAFGLKGNTDAWDTRLRFALPRGYVRSSSDTAAPDGDVFLGPKSYMKGRGTFSFVAPPNLPPALEGFIQQQFDTAIAIYSAKLKANLPTKPVVIAQISSELRGFEGSVSSGFVTYLRFPAINWGEITPANTAYFGSFIPHEVFHFWNGGVVDSNGAASWLSEGGAEYASRLVAIGDTPGTRAALNSELSDNLNTCNRALSQFENAALDKVDFIPGSVRYPCGMMMMWAADMAVRRDSGGARTFFNVWADMVARGLARADRSYNVDDFDQFVRGNNAAPIEAIRLLREETGPTRFGKFVEALKAQGAVIEQASTIHTRRSGILQHILSQSCARIPGTSFGYGLSDENVVTLDTHQGCGVLSGKPTVTHIDGFDINRMTQADYIGVQTKCSANQSLAFKLGDGRTVDVVCPAPLRDAQTDYSIVSWNGP